MSTLFQSVCNLSGSGNFFLVLLAFVKIVRLQGANAYIWAVLFEPRMKCADRNLPHSFFFKCAVEFVQHTVIALVLILWIISVGGSQGCSLSWGSGGGLLEVYWGWTDAASAGDQEEVY